jgi:large subunit ribosomal protein L14
MIYKRTKLIPADQCGVYWVRVFHLYGGGQRKVSYVGEFIKTSVIFTKSENWLKKKAKLNGVLIRLRKESYRADGSSIIFKKNQTVLLKKRLTPRGKELLGPVDANVKRRKFMSSFSGII